MDKEQEVKQELLTKKEQQLRQERIDFVMLCGIPMDHILAKGMIDGPAIGVTPHGSSRDNPLKLFANVTEEQEQEIKRLEEDGTARVLAVLSHSLAMDINDVFEIDAYILQTFEEEELPAERESIGSKSEMMAFAQRPVVYVFSYCKNLTYDFCSDYGDIGVEWTHGCLVRRA